VSIDEVDDDLLGGEARALSLLAVTSERRAATPSGATRSRALGCFPTLTRSRAGRADLPNRLIGERSP
jgi:hypothetical protein